jgi:hypothetical protein
VRTPGKLSRKRSHFDRRVRIVAENSTKRHNPFHNDSERLLEEAEKRVLDIYVRIGDT